MTPRDHDGVIYASAPGAQHLKMFRCEPYRATVSQKGCGERWLLAQAMDTKTPSRSGIDNPPNRISYHREAVEAFASCRGCPIGASHAGQDFIRYSRHYETMVCPRCRKGSMRMIGGTRCVSCYNREGEKAKGRNARGNLIATGEAKALEVEVLPVVVEPAKGKKPRKPLSENRGPGRINSWSPAKDALRPFRLLVTGDGPPRPLQVEAVDVVEVYLRTLRTTKGNLGFAFAPRRRPPGRQLALALAA